MGKNNSHIIIPRTLLRAHKQGIVLSVILFGSSLYSPDPKDVDLAIVIARGRFEDFLKSITDNHMLEKYDISLIKKEEIDRRKKFYFGSHGQYLVESFRKGIVLVGENPFKNYPPTKIRDIKLSVFVRMREYAYILRKGYFDKNAENKFYSRYNKILKLSALLLTDDYVFPEVLNTDIEDIQNSLIKIGCALTEDKKRNVENLWTKINALYS